MRVLTYNLLAGHGDDAVRLRAAILLLQAAAPDVLVLNECTLLALDDGARLRALEAVLGMHATLALAPTGYHVALLVRAAISVRACAVEGGLSHAALVGALRVGSQELQVVAAHLDPFSPAKRLREVDVLLARIDADRPALLLGDLNAISPRDVASLRPDTWVERYRARHLDASGALDVRAIAALERHKLVDVHAALHPQTLMTRPTSRYASGDRPSQRLDYIFASNDLARSASACAPFDHPLAQTTSDHLPLYADFAWP
jgi:exodeoxyribonuclease-3